MARVILLLLFAASLSAGCARVRPKAVADYRTVKGSSVVDTEKAKARHIAGVEFLAQRCFGKAEQCLQDALIFDSTYGPAHNTLGKVYYDQEKYYLAAWEFEHAIKSMPQRAEPINNLGLVYEAVDQFESAIAQYQIAHEIAPEDPRYLGNLLRARIRLGEDPIAMRTQLERLILLDDRRSWVDWAKRKIALSYPQQIVNENELIISEVAIEHPQFESTEVQEVVTPYTQPPFESGIVDSPEVPGLETLQPLAIPQ